MATSSSLVRVPFSLSPVRETLHVTDLPVKMAQAAATASPDALVEHLDKVGLTAADSKAYVFSAKGGEPSGVCELAHAFVAASGGFGGFVEGGIPRPSTNGSYTDGGWKRRPEGGPNPSGTLRPRLTLAVYAQATSGADRAAAETIGNALWERYLKRRGMLAGLIPTSKASEQNAPTLTCKLGRAARI
jgi:hypothetical protein